MSEPEKTPALRLKLRSPANPLDQVGVSPAKVMRLAFARACEDVAKFEAAVTGFDEGRSNLVQIVEALRATDLIVATKTPAGAMGLAILDAEATATFVEQLICGRVSPKRADDRAPTATDAAVIREILDAILAGFDLGINRMAASPPVSGFRKSGIFTDGRAVSMAMADVPYRRYSLQLDLGSGTRNGQLQLIFPWQSCGEKTPCVEAGGDWQATWHRVVADASAPVMAVLHRALIPLGRLNRFEIGTLVPVPSEAIGRICLQGSDQRPVARGRLGQSNGHRAVRIMLEDELSDGATGVSVVGNTKTAHEMADMMQMPDGGDGIQGMPMAPVVEPEAMESTALEPAMMEPAVMEPSMGEPISGLPEIGGDLAVNID